MRKTLMILGAGKNELPAVLKARQMGIKTIVVDMDPSAPALEYADVAVVAKTREVEEYIDIARKNKIDGVMTVSVDSLVRVISRVVEELNLLGISYESAGIATDKYRTRQLCRKHNIPSVNFFVASDIKEAESYLDGLEWPLVIKPTDRAGSRGVFKLRGSGDLKKFFPISKDSSREGKVLVEEFVEGPGSTIDSLTVNGNTHILGISDKLVVETPNLIAMDLTFPAAYPKAILGKVEELTRHLIKSAGIENGACHTEIIVDRGEPKLIEFGARAGGALIPSDILPHICGFDPIEKYILLALGEDVPMPKSRPGTAAVLRFFNAPLGRLKKIHGFDRALKIKGVRRLEFMVKEGDLLRPLAEGKDRYGFVITWGRNRDEAVRIADEVQDTIKFDVERIYGETPAVR